MGLKENYAKVKVFWNDSDKKPVLLMLKEFFGLWAIKKSFPIHYIIRFLYRNEYKNPYDYLDMKQYRSIILSKKNNQEEYVHLLSDKFLFSLLCEKYGLPSPKVVSYNMNGSFFYNGKVQSAGIVEELFECFKNVLQTSGVKRLFIKSFCGYGGTEVFLLEYSSLKEDLKKFGNIILTGAFVHQEGIVQHAEVNKIYPHSINTLRVETYIENSGKINILGMVMRFGAGGKFVDNLSSGGFSVPVEPLTGNLMPKGLQRIRFGGNVYYRHPDTDFEFKGYKIPYFNEARQLCLQLAQHIPNRLVGWDIALTPNGPVVIEGNHTPGIMLGEIGYGGYVKHPLFNEMIGRT
ncbi:sugar-transfer associated ATP-grasp domain-containing protein [Pricia sp. S334]|uniref:Sugar-transfer associated ATP-grasp domain-containing protein n=1 Tax=Pricia mediterranea TaxID=3076079 RepID=A0ABU3L6H6_9FLAO|nr:sugar-transfer associated ATP-grasp domain-containing protein [Pricia sp. S334]MDT7829339.1 sugar-transfer associated ATP-grasp domain-containing protein [Pricia sp. S334]